MKYRGFSLTADNNNNIEIQPYINENRLIIPYPCQCQYSCFPYVIEFEEGTYTIELYGASGGNATSSIGGKGGYTKSIIHFFQTQKYYLLLGGSGQNYNSNSNEGGFNGGGTATNIRGSGGGATDIRLVRDNLSTRILVAAGGGGAMDNTGGVSTNGGDGGGLIGNLGELYYNEKPCVPTQNGCVNGTDEIAMGTFGYGANASDTHKIGGGGGGWWGGGSANGCGSARGSSHIEFPILGNTESGKNTGNGYAIITKISPKISCIIHTNNNEFVMLTFILLLCKN